MTRVAVLLIALTALLATAGCGGSSTTTSRSAKTYEFVIPPGTAKKIAAGERVSLMPANLTIRVGDRLRVKNDDDKDQWVGPYYVEAGQVFDIQYRSPGTFTGVCNLADGKKFYLTVTQ